MDDLRVGQIFDLRMWIDVGQIFDDVGLCEDCVVVEARTGRQSDQDVGIVDWNEEWDEDGLILQGTRGVVQGTRTV